MSYLLYVILYYQVYKLWKKGVVKGIRNGVVYPILASIGSLFVLIGGLTNPQFIIFVAICLISIVGGYIYGGKAYNDVKM